MAPKSPRTRYSRWDKLYRLAGEQYGYFTLAQAVHLGFSQPLIVHHTNTGSFTRAARGIYRVSFFPWNIDEDFALLWLQFDRLATFSHVTALEMYGLLDVLPERVEVTLPRQYATESRRWPMGVRIHFATIPRTQVEHFGALPVTAPLRTFVDCVEDGVDLGLLATAASNAVADGLIRPRDLRQLPGDVLTRLPAPVRGQLPS